MPAMVKVKEILKINNHYLPKKFKAYAIFCQNALRVRRVMKIATKKPFFLCHTLAKGMRIFHKMTAKLSGLSQGANYFMW